MNKFTTTEIILLPSEHMSRLDNGDFRVDSIVVAFLLIFP